MLICLVVGCGPTRDWSGRYSGTLNPPVDHPNPDVARTLSAVNLEIKRGTFDLFYQGMSYSGSVQAGMEDAQLEITKVANRPAETAMPPLRLKWKNESELELLDGTMSVTLRRAQASGPDATASSTGS